MGTSRLLVLLQFCGRIKAANAKNVLLVPLSLPLVSLFRSCSRWKDFKGQLLAENLYFYIVILLGVS